MVFLRQVLICPRLALHSLCSQGQPWICNPSVSITQVLGLLEYIAISLIYLSVFLFCLFVLFCFFETGFLCIVLAVLSVFPLYGPGWTCPTFLAPPPQCWDPRLVPTCPAGSLYSKPQLLSFGFALNLFYAHEYTVTIFRHTRRGHQIPLQLAVSHHVVLGLELRTSGRAVSALNC